MMSDEFVEEIFTPQETGNEIMTIKEYIKMEREAQNVKRAQKSGDE